MSRKLRLQQALQTRQSLLKIYLIKKPSGIASVDPQDEVLAGRVNKPELLYKDQEIETKLDFSEVVQENPEPTEGTIHVKTRRSCWEED